MDRPLRIGDTLYGTCHGYLDSYYFGDGRVEAIGADWIVVRYENGVDAVTDINPDDFVQFTEPEDEST